MGVCGLAMACSGGATVLDDGSAPDEGTPEGTSSDATAHDPADPIRAVELWVHDVYVSRLHARVVFAHDVKAEGGSVGSFTQHECPKNGSRRDLHVDELDVDVLYAHDVHADVIEIGDVKAHKLELR